MKNIEIFVGLGSCGIAAGASKTYDKLSELVGESVNIKLEKTSCIGMCYQEPLVEIRDNGKRFLYGQVDEKIASEIYESHIKNNTVVDNRLVYTEDGKGCEVDFVNSQEKIVLRNCGLINPEKIEDYLENGGYKAAKSLVDNENYSEYIIKTILDSGLRGRGGGGFPTGRKWSIAAANKADEKYVICNADEGDPGAFMDRSVLEGDPHSVIEGMLICALAIGGTAGVIYCRAEYPLAIKRLNLALSQAREKGYLGKNIFGKDGLNFDIYVKEGAGAFVCGEETALIGSIEGKRGMPNKRPPFPAQSGLWGKPTNINNVETYANVPWIILNGADKFASFGTENSKGTKVFALAGKVVKSGLVEVPMGIKIKDIVFEIGGGIPNGRAFKAVQLGGPSGGCIPAELADTPVDYDSLQKTGAIMGSGGLVVMDDTTCMVDVAKFFLKFTQKESCGKCTFCRIGTKRMLEILERITDGKGEMEDLDKLEELAYQIKDASLCGLGQTAPNPVLTTLKYFRNEYIAHIKDRVCPARSCSKLLTYTVIEDKCRGCTACLRVCPASAIDGKAREIHFIKQDACIKCGACVTACKFDAISVK
ncbi:MAG: NADH-quinone oxidoreductase subunit NuoF [Candidatus Delongbacteria bacterium]|nr:NADH-quinone oxidoreductase subunit NuoF [Candidatus Delongbacteria bacterium]MBN2835479.1 NADH-quinone oxidoreductase subunit NuoF [Candidatus Delongbacteria bacterium]